MATLLSPGVSVSVIDESMNVGAGPGTVPLIFIATQQDKSAPDGVTLASGTTKAAAGTVYSITSQRELVQTFGDPVFYSVAGSALNGYPLNEYGLLAAYSYLGSSNLVRIVRADIDTAQLEPSGIQPTSPAAVGTYWLDETAAPNGTSWGLFRRTGISPNETWSPVTFDYVLNFPTGLTNEPTGGVDGEYAVVFQAENGWISYWLNIAGTWTQLSGSATILYESVWPDLNSVSSSFWVKTGSAAQGANVVLRRMDATLGQFTQIECPILANDIAADAYYSTNANGSDGQIYAQKLVGSVTGLLIRKNTGGTWAALGGITGSSSVPTQGPANGSLWFNSEIGVDGSGQITVDILIADGSGGWQNAVLDGWDDLDTVIGAKKVFAQASDPRDNTPAPSLVYGDIWVDTDQTEYPVIYRWNSTAWVLVDNEDQVSNNGIIFADARPNPMYHNGAYTGENNGGGSNPDLDPDAPDADLYPAGFMLWNTRFSTNNVKEWQFPFVANSITAEADDTNGDTTGRWVTVSGNSPTGAPFMGTAAQNIMVVRALQSAINSNEQIRAEDFFFNLIATPGYVETIDEMLVLNTDRKETAFVIGDTPFTLPATGTALQSWSTNGENTYGNNSTGLVSASKYFATWYPSGLSSNVDGTDVVVPPSHMALKTIAYNDQVSYPWFAPAGLQRGIVNNAASVGYLNQSGQFVPAKLNEGQRDILQQNGVNPIRVMPQGGIVVFGQKTRQPFASATDRINVVRLENYLRYQFDILAQPFLFEPNDSITRKAVKDSFDRFLAELITLRGIYDFLVVVDESNNTPARVDRNELWIDVAIQPTKAVEMIYIPIRIKNTGADLSL